MDLALRILFIKLLFPKSIIPLHLKLIGLNLCYNRKTHLKSRLTPLPRPKAHLKTTHGNTGPFQVKLCALYVKILYHLLNHKNVILALINSLFIGRTAFVVTVVPMKVSLRAILQ